MITIHVTRDSVAMGDDCFAPHLLEFQLSQDAIFKQFFNVIKQHRYLAQVNGENHCWVLQIGDQELSVLLGNAPLPEDENLLNKHLADYCDNAELAVHFSYSSRRDIKNHCN